MADTIILNVYIDGQRALVEIIEDNSGKRALIAGPATQPAQPPSTTTTAPPPPPPPPQGTPTVPTTPRPQDNPESSPSTPAPPTPQPPPTPSTSTHAQPSPNNYPIIDEEYVFDEEEDRILGECEMPGEDDDDDTDTETILYLQNGQRFSDDDDFQTPIEPISPKYKKRTPRQRTRNKEEEEQQQQQQQQPTTRRRKRKTSTVSKTKRTKK